MNPLLKAEQVSYILNDCNVRVLVTSRERLASLSDVLPGCADLKHVIVAGTSNGAGRTEQRALAWSDVASADTRMD